MFNINKIAANIELMFTLELNRGIYTNNATTTVDLIIYVNCKVYMFHCSLRHPVYADSLSLQCFNTVDCVRSLCVRSGLSWSTAVKVWPIRGKLVNSANCRVCDCLLAEPDVLSGHTSNLRCCLWLPQMQRIVSASDDKTVR